MVPGYLLISTPLIYITSLSGCCQHSTGLGISRPSHNELASTTWDNSDPFGVRFWVCPDFPAIIEAVEASLITDNSHTNHTESSTNPLRSSWHSRCRGQYVHRFILVPPAQNSPHLDPFIDSWGLEMQRQHLIGHILACHLHPHNNNISYPFSLSYPGEIPLNETHSHSLVKLAVVA